MAPILENYELIYDDNSRCFHLLDFSNTAPGNDGIIVGIIPKQNIIRFIFEHFDDLKANKYVVGE